MSGAGLAGWAAWAFFHDDGAGNGSAAPPPPAPSATAATPTYAPDLSRFYEQDLDWRSCGGNQCTRLTVPLDYAHPEGKSISLAVLRVPASDRGRRVGQLVVNPGGPGGSGIDYATAGEGAFGPLLTRYYDIVGFDPRGVGKSTPLECADTAQTDEFLSADPDPDNPAEVATARPPHEAVRPGLPDQERRPGASASPPSRPRRTWTSCAPRWVSGSWTTSARRTAPSWAPPTPTCSRRTCAGWSSTARSTRPCPTSS